ncbi:MAG: hypothetical protein IPL77_18585 [Flavobacteriales bacterium]|nr:hypothetical protein [Flavobacteriales bacterium]
MTSTHAIRCLLLLVALTVCSQVHASHIYGGEIRYQHLSGHTYAIDVILFVRSSSVDPTDQLILDLGDGSWDTIGWAESDLLPNDTSWWDVARVTYPTLHSYLGSGSYTLQVSSQNRNEGILNIPNSVNQEFCLRALLVIDPLLGPNSSVHFTAPQNDAGFSWSTWLHHPVPDEPDGDSLSFDLVEPRGMGCGNIPGYQEPFEVGSVPGSWNGVDPVNGTFAWYFPKLSGEYVFAIRAREWRNGTLIGEVTRDMSLVISPMFWVNGVAEERDLEVITVFPSSEAGVFRVLSTSAISLAVVDALGRKMEEQRFSTGEVLLDLRGHAAGTYALVVVRNDGRRSAQRVIVP